ERCLRISLECTSVTFSVARVGRRRRVGDDRAGLLRKETTHLFGDKGERHARGHGALVVNLSSILFGILGQNAAIDARSSYKKRRIRTDGRIARDSYPATENTRCIGGHVHIGKGTRLQCAITSDLVAQDSFRQT